MAEPLFKVKNRNKVLWALRRMGHEVEEETKKASGKIAERFLADVRSNARTPRQYIAVSAADVRTHLVPRVAFGGSVLMATSEPVTAGKLFFGTEFGNRWPRQGGKGRWFQPHSGKQGHFVYPTLRSHGKEYATMWHRAVDDVLDRAAARSREAARGK